MNLRKATALLFECEYRVLLIIFLFLFVGLAVGAFYSCRIDLPNAVPVNEIISASLPSLLLKNILILTVAFLFGYAVIGAPLNCILLLYCGVSCGLFLGIIARNYGFRGCLFATLCFYLYYLLNFIALAYVSYSSMRLSLALFHVFKDKTRYVSPGIYIKPHLLRFCVFAGLTALSCIYYVYLARTVAVIII